ncbi:MAG: hypothetical protein K5924_08990 [Chloroflexi bacterium]|nr:hypothetical protein [Chloroflexota bacterium]
MKRTIVVAVTLALVLGALPMSTILGSAATFTTVNDSFDGTGHCKNGNPGVNCNIYDGKEFVWLNGGPDGAALADGEYFFAVLAPGGQPNPNDGTAKNLSDDFTTRDQRTFTSTGGVLSAPSGHLLDSNLIRLAPYADTPNNGGVYILAICGPSAGSPATASQCKYDAFKIRAGQPAEPLEGCLSGTKFYDTNNDGQRGSAAAEPGIAGWSIYVAPPATVEGGSIKTVATDSNGDWQVCFGAPANGSLAGTYDIREGVAPAASGWTQTYPNATTTWSGAKTANATVSVAAATKSYTVSVSGDDDFFVTSLDFGNVCVSRPGGLTMGFWSNRIGQALIDAADRTALNSFYLANGSGADTNFANNGAYKNWLLAASATNMAYMLSAQMSATYLNTVNAYGGSNPITNPNAIVTNSCGTFDTTADGCSVAELIGYAQWLITNNPYTVAASAARTEQERVKNLFDAINNNQNLVLPPGTCAVPTLTNPFGV